MKSILAAMTKRTTDVLFWIFVAYMIAEAGNTYLERAHGFVWTKAVVYTESNRELSNPNRGFYSMYGFMPKDNGEDFTKTVTDRLKDDNNALALIQINLGNYASGSISEQGMRDINDIFTTLKSFDKQYIVRFLYDWDGRNMETEPENVETIYGHMKQLETIFQTYEDIIFIHQGVFLGNWGEMHGTKHSDYMSQLIFQLEQVLGEKTYMAVRTPVQWRIATGLTGLTGEEALEQALGERLGLFNDGILGTVTDCGTYGEHSSTEVGNFVPWAREEELVFQSELCKWVPNGGEVIIENSLNDFEYAVDNLQRMHVSYLNQDYDLNVLNKWSGSIMKEKGCFDGMDGLTYIERHLGYRLLINRVQLDYDFWNDLLCIEIKLQNTGFAPLYKEPETVLIIRRSDTGEQWSYLVEANLRELAGGGESSILHSIRAEISLEEFVAANYEVFLTIRDTDSNWYIELANEQEMHEMGYKLGEIQIDDILAVAELKQKLGTLREDMGQ